MGPTPVVSSRYDSAPRHPRSFAGVAGRAARALTTAACALALATGAITAAPAPARADDTITTQEYFSYYHLDQARAKGYTGKGVTIALIDGPVELSDPELAGANITDKSRCTIEASAEDKYHGSEMAALLVSQKYGVAPEATLHTYQARSGESSTAGGSCEVNGVSYDGLGLLINQAIDDGAQVISVSLGSTERDLTLKWAIARAMEEGVIILGASGNTGKDNNDHSLGWWSGVVGVAAIDLDGKPASYSSPGQGVITTGVGGPVTVRDFDTGKTATTRGTSNSTAIVAGLMALARQKWPNATANQLLQLLVTTGLNINPGWNPETGYGAASISDLVNVDPSQYPDENPIAQKQGGSSPTVEEVEQFADGLVDPTGFTIASTYVYRGTNEQVLSNNVKTTTHLGTSPAYHRK